MSDRIAVMQDGRIVQLGAPDEVYLHPETPFVAGFLGETNLLRGECVAQRDGHAVVRFADGVTGPARLSRGGAQPHVGAAVLASIRPERIGLLRPDANAACASDANAACASDATGRCVIEGVVTDRVFLGRHTRLTIQALGRTLIVSTAEPPPSEVARGAVVRVGWSRDDAQILNETDDTTE
jgi:ABC-type Fe3+/spermidine/putrescine transport system ATPase subunit